MPRRARFEIAGIPQHIVQRGNDRQSVFLDDEDRQRYLRLATHRAARCGVAVHAYVLMGNHVHLLLTAQQTGQVSSFMHDLGSMYVGWFNERHGRTGGLWEGRFRNCLVECQTYLWNCHRYVEFNPVRAGLAAHPGAYRWSSYAANALGRFDALVTPRPEYLALGDSASSRCSAYARFVSLAGDADEFAGQRLRTAGTLGSELFEADMATRRGTTFPPRSRGRPRKVPSPTEK